VLGGFTGVVCGLFVMLGGGLRVMRSLLEVASFVEVRGLLLVPRGVMIVRRCLTMMLCWIGHVCFLSCECS